MKKLLVTVLLVIVISSAVFAEITYSPSVYGTVGGAFCHPTANYLKSSQGKELPKMRTSWYAGFDAMLLDVVFDNNWEVGGGFAMQWTSQSLAAGTHVLQPYLGMGLAIQTQNHLKENFYLGLKTRLLFCKFRPYDYKFDTLDLEVLPVLKSLEEKNFEIDMVTPITFSFKSDAITTRAGIGFCIKYNIKFNEEPEPTEQVEESIPEELQSEIIEVVENEGGQTV